MAWTEEKKLNAVEQYLAADPTAETSMEVVKTIADDLDETVNGVRMVLSKAGVYIKKDGSTSDKKTTGTTRVSKEDSIAELARLIEDAGHTVDEDILNKLTGKAAVYFASILGKAD